MSGHSKWSTIKHKKAAVDAKRGKIFTKIIREITVAARTGGGDIETNPPLRLAISKAKDVNMPQDNILRAIKKGTGEGADGQSFDEIIYEGYGPNGVAVMALALTDNKNRTAAEVRSIFNKRGGNLAGQGAVSFLFHKKGIILIPLEGNPGEEELFLTVTEAGAIDFKKEDDYFEVTTEPSDLEQVRKTLEDQGIKIDKGETQYVPETRISITEEEAARQFMQLIESLEDSDDVQAVYENSDISTEVLEKINL